MRQMRGVDAYHILEESPAQHMHTMKVLVLDPAAASGRAALTLERVRSHIMEQAAGIAPLRQRVMTIPFGLGRPVWVDAGDPDPGYHVRAATLPAPGEPEQLNDLVAEVASTPLDRSRPLWQLWFVDGLADGRRAFVIKMHHSMADGGASVTILEELLAPSGPAPSVPSGSERGSEGELTKSVLVRRALRNQALQWATFPVVVGRTAASLRAGRARKQAGGTGLIRPLTGPMTRFNRPLTPNRIYADVTVPLASLQAAKVAFGATLNDVYLALCGGAIRRYLIERGELPDETLTGTSPVSIRAETGGRYYNATSYWYVSLATDLADPAARVEAVSQSTRAARAFAEADRGLFTDWQDFYSLFRMFSVTMLGLAERRAGRPVFNVIVSNVRGPGPLAFDGVPVVAVRSMGPLVGLEGLNFTAWSYCGDLAIGIHACREHAPDLRRLTDHLRDELAAVEAVAAQIGRTAARPGHGPGSG